MATDKPSGSAAAAESDEEIDLSSEEVWGENTPSDPGFFPNPRTMSSPNLLILFFFPWPGGGGVGTGARRRALRGAPEGPGRRLPHITAPQVRPQVEAGPRQQEQVSEIFRFFFFYLKLRVFYFLLGDEHCCVVDGWEGRWR